MTLQAVQESQRRIEQRLEDVWRAISASPASTALPDRQKIASGAFFGSGGGAASTEDPSSSSPPLALLPPPQQSAPALDAPATKEDGGAGTLLQSEGEEEGEEESEVCSKRSGCSSSGRTDNYLVWSLPEAWPSNLQGKRFGRESSEATGMTQIFKESVSEPISSLQAPQGHGQLLHALATDLADLNLKSVHRRLLLDPHGPTRVIFDVASCIFLLYDLVGLPIFLAWDIQIAGTLWTLALCTDLFWVADFMLNFFTGYFLAGVLIMEPVSVVKHYARTWMMPDLFILVCNFTGLWLSDGSDMQSQTVKFMRFAKLTRLLRIVNVVRLLRMNEVVERVADRVEGLNLTEILEAPSLVCLIVFINHMIACCWFAIGRSSLSGSDTGSSWLQTPLARTGQSDRDETYETAPMLYQYLSSMHWSITQMTPGSLQVHAVNSFERAFTVLCLICGMVFFSSIVSSLTATLTKQRLRRQAKANELKTLRKLLRQATVPTALVIAAQKQGSERLKSGSQHVVADVREMRFLSDNMRMRLHYEICRKHLLHPFLRWWEVVDIASVQRLCQHGVDHLYLHRHDALFHAGAAAKAAYVVKLGRLMYSQDRHTARVSALAERRVNAGDWLCEAALWTEWIHVGHAEAVCVSEVMSVNAEQFKQVVEASRLSVFVCNRYGAAFHARVTSAKPPSSKYPTDLEVPGCSFEEIVPSLPLAIREVISGAAFRQMRLSMWTRPNLIKDLAEQVQNGKCTLALSADKVVERFVAVVTLQLTRADGRFLVELLEHKAGSWKDSCMLPGTKQREGETPSLTIGRLAQTLSPYTDGMAWSHEGCNAERVSNTNAANVRCVYFRQTYQASMQIGLEGGQDSPVSCPGFVPGGILVLPEEDKEPQSGACGEATLHPDGEEEELVKIGAEVKQEAALDVDTVLLQGLNFKAYGWLSPEEFEHFKSDRGRKQLSFALEDLRAQLLDAASAKQLRSI